VVNKIGLVEKKEEGRQVHMEKKSGEGKNETRVVNKIGLVEKKEEGRQVHMEKKSGEGKNEIEVGHVANISSLSLPEVGMEVEVDGKDETFNIQIHEQKTESDDELFDYGFDDFESGDDERLSNLEIPPPPPTEVGMEVEVDGKDENVEIHEIQSEDGPFGNGFEDFVCGAPPPPPPSTVGEDPHFGDLGEMPGCSKDFNSDGSRKDSTTTTTTGITAKPFNFSPSLGPLFAPFFTYNFLELLSDQENQGDFPSAPKPVSQATLKNNFKVFHKNDLGHCVGPIKVFGPDSNDEFTFYGIGDMQAIKLPIACTQEFLQCIVMLLHNRAKIFIEKEFEKLLNPVEKKIKNVIMNKALALKALDGHSQKRHREIHERIEGYDRKIEQFLMEKKNLEIAKSSELELQDFNCMKRAILHLKTDVYAWK
jgi:hypothetical protein